MSRRCHLNKEKTNETALCRATGHRRFRGSNWFGTDRRGHVTVQQSPGNAQITATPGAAAQQAAQQQQPFGGDGRPAVPPLTTAVRLGGGPSDPAVRAMGLGRRASRALTEIGAQRDIERAKVIAAHPPDMSAPYPANVNGIALLSRGGPQPDLHHQRGQPLGMNLVCRAIRSGGVEFCTATGQNGRWRGSRGANTDSLTSATKRRRLGHACPPNTGRKYKAPSNIKSSSTEQQTTIDSSEDWNRSQKD